MASTSNWKVPHHLEEKDMWILPAGVVTWVAIANRFKRKDAKVDDKGEYSITILVPPQHKLDDLKDAANDYARDVWPRIDLFDKKLAKGKKHPFKEGKDITTELLDPEGEEVDLSDWTEIRAKSYKKVSVRNASGELLDEDEIEDLLKNGAWARPMVKFRDYDVSGNTGVGFWLESVQIINKKPYGVVGSGASSTGEEFGAVDDEKPGKKSSSKRSRDDDDEDEKPARRKASRDDDEDDDRPTRKRSRASEDDEDEKPARRRRVDDDDDEDERPARRRRARDDDDEV